MKRDGAGSDERKTGRKHLFAQHARQKCTAQRFSNFVIPLPTKIMHAFMQSPIFAGQPQM
jgi:hypothetical protein